MTSRDFIYHPKRLENHVTTIIQTKLKTLLKCYTITNFKINKEEQTFTFNKSHMINGIRMNDPKEHSGIYSIEVVDDVTSKITISV